MLLNRRGFLWAGACASLASGRLLAATPQQAPLSVTTDEIDEDVTIAARFLRSFTLDWAEVRSVWGRYVVEQPLDKVREARSILDAHQIRVSVLDTPFFRELLPPETPQGRAALDKEWRVLDASFECAKILGADRLRTFAFSRNPKENPDAAALARIEGRIFELLREAARRAARHNLLLAVENLEGSYFSTGAQSARLLKNVRDDALGLTWDPTNAITEGENAFPDGFALLDAARIFNVHLRDYRRLPSGKVVWCAVGEGAFDNLSQIRALIKGGYKGRYNLETHFHHPDGKLAASRASLSALMKIVEQA